MKKYALNNIAVLLCIFVFLPISKVFGQDLKNLGKFGRSYQIEEQDALSELQEQAKKVDWNKAINKERTGARIENFKPASLYSLPKALKNRVFLTDMTYTAEMDVPDGNGKILYPKGYSFNPLDYLNYPNVLIIINGDDPEQRSWFEKSSYFNDYRTKILLADGSYADLSKRWQRPVFYLTDKIAKRLKIQSVPSVIKQKGRFMEVFEAAVGDRKSKER